MKLYTSVEISPVSPKITYRRKGLLVGSCFADSIGLQLDRMKFPVTVNPFGVLYNPASMVRALLIMEEGGQIVPGDLPHCNGLYYSPDFHSFFSDPDPEVAAQNMNGAVAKGREALTQCDYLVLTLGTAVVYRSKEEGRIVCNCHKLPPQNFTSEMLDASDITGLFGALFDREPYRGKQIILTVSPVRHQKDGLVVNSLSKATLRVAAGMLERRYPFVHYFPAYEIMLDELRDYRFYGADMLHPSEQAVQYIWERFADACIGEEDRSLFPRLQKIAEAMTHRPFHEHSDAHRKFREKMRTYISDLSRDYPMLDLTSEFAFFGDRT